ncbi:MAG: DUF3617 domain-containing protein [Thiohalomonadaceae bacterium]
MQIAWKFVASALLLAMVIPAQASNAIKTGLWESTITTEVEGMPFSPPPITTTDCITKEDLTPSMDMPEQNCDVMEHQVKGSEVSWRLRCSHEGMVTTGQGQIRYSGDSYKGEMTMSIAGGPMGEMKMKQILTGKRLGDCQ